MTETTVIHAAQAIYSCYHRVHGGKHIPVGVVVDRETLRGHVIFQNQAVLLPRECFISAEQFTSQSPQAAAA